MTLETKKRSMQQIMEEWDQILPHWAIRKATPNYLEAGNQLCTRDGRYVGNANIIEVLNSKLDKSRPYYHVLTDAGTLIIMNSTEINERFWPPKYVSDVANVLLKFKREIIEPS